ncbi:MAG: hypothetical protein QOI55_2739 [Actinomycetota bacterium]|nr:hypothetical protein [Actinomycetota bacterium]
MFVVLVVTVAGAGCNGSGSSGMKTGGTTTTVRRKLPAPCSLLTAADARVFLGAPAPRVPAVNEADRREQCAYATNRARQLILLRETNNVRVLSSGGTTVSSVDVGEQAYLRAGDPAGTSTLAFRQRGVVVSLLFSDVTVVESAGATRDRERALVALGKRIASRL